MKVPATTPDEEDRLQLLDEMAIVHSPAEERFDRIARLAVRIFDVPIALVSLVTANTQWFKSSQGLTVCETSREVSFCGHAIHGDDTLIVPDATKDPDFADNPLVVNDPKIRFYAGHPIRLNSVKLGTLCIIDQRPRRFNPAHFDTLKSLALWIENELTLSLYRASQKELYNKVGELERKSLIDSVTGCWNQRGIDLLLKKELSRSHRADESVALLIIDLGKTMTSRDNNISYKNSDTILKQIAQQVRSTIRSHDVVGKIEKHQFLVYLNDCNREMCRDLTQRILRNITITRFKEDGIKITLSVNIGSASNESTDIWSPTLLVETAKDALKLAIEENTSNGYYILTPKIGA